MSGEQNIFFPQNKKILNLCLGWYILRGYHFEAKVTFNDQIVDRFLYKNYIVNGLKYSYNFYSHTDHMH